MADVSRSSAPRSAARRWAARWLAALFAVALLWFPGLGLIDLVAAVLGGELAVFWAGYGLLVGFMLPVALLTISLRPNRAQTPVLQVLAGAAAFLITAVAGALPTAVVGAVVLVLMALALTWLLDVEISLRLVRRPIAGLLAALAGAGLVPAALYAGYLCLQQRRQAAPYEDFTLGHQGWSAVAALTITLVLSAATIALRPNGWRLSAVTTAAASIMFGCLVAARPDLPASPGLPGAALFVAWGVALLAATARTPTCAASGR